MRHHPTQCLLVVVSLILGTVVGLAQMKSPATPDWALNATIIEACSCPMFCQCYFNPQPAAHADHDGHGGAAKHYCRFNNAFRVNRGHFGSVTLDGVKFWLAGDLGGDFSAGRLDWAVLLFDRSTTPEQREAIKTILGSVYPAKWTSFTVGTDGVMEWSDTADRAVAKLDGGKTAEVVLRRHPGNTDQPVVIHNLRYWGVPRNDGFVLMPNEVEAYRVGPKAFEYRGTNGFMITIDITSRDTK